MKNRELYAKDPGKNELVNNGVAQVTDGRTPEQLKTLRYELETFVCEGQYGKGLERILSTFLTSLSKSEQPAVWVSGFFGSGKSHLVKMLRYLWVDFEFPDDHARARGIVHVSQEVDELLRELSTAGKKHGGLHAAAGTLGSGAGDSVRLALLQLIFGSAGLPEDYAAARFVLWLRHAELLDKVQSHVHKAKKDFDKELKHLYVSPVIAQALRAADPDFAKSDADARALLKAQYPPKEDVTNTEMEDAIRDALTVDGQFPCTLIVLDEVQQYIGDNSDRTYRIQEVTEACSKRFGGQLLFVGTGQTALTGTPQLQKLKDRFRIPIELSDADVETVIRQIVLQKRADKETPLKEMLNRQSGEISRHLNGTKIEPRPEDDRYLVTDYPLLPVRRRFWERTLRAVDRAGTAGQLRTQLKIVHEAVRATADKPVGHVVPGDFVFDQTSTDLIQTGVLLREIDEKIKKLRDGTADGDLKSRLCALVFLIGKLPRDAGIDQGIRAKADVLADLLVEDLQAGSADLRKRIPELLASLVQAGHLMQVESEFRIQTREGAEWERDYGDRYTKLVNDEQRLAGYRADILRTECAEKLKSIKLTHGNSKVPRKVELHFTADPPQPTSQTIPIWVRDGWNDDEKSVLADARAAGTDSPTVYVFVPRRSNEEFRKALASVKAAEETLHARGLPTAPEGIEARRAMETRQAIAQQECDGIVVGVFSGARVIQGGGTEKSGSSLAENVEDAARDSLVRMFPQFDLADDARWGTAVERVRKGDGNALEAVGYSGDAEKHPVCDRVLAHIGSGKKGRDVRKHFLAPPYGWPQDAVDAAILVLVASGHVTAKYDGQAATAKQLDQAKIGVAEFRVENITLSTTQKIAVRKLFQSAGFHCKPDEESAIAIRFLTALRERAAAAGGEAPLPEKPSTSQLDEINQLSGNEQLLALYEARDMLARQAETWQRQSEMIVQRQPRWKTLLDLLGHADGEAIAEELRPQIDAIRQHRSLLADPDPVPPLCDKLCQTLRQAVIAAHGQYQATYSEQMKQLVESDNWRRLSEDQGSEILRARGLEGVPEIHVGTERELLGSLNQISLADWHTRRDALGQRFADAQVEAARLLEPKATRISLPKATLKNEGDMEAWIDAVRDQIRNRLEEGPVIIT